MARGLDVHYDGEVSYHIFLEENYANLGKALNTLDPGNRRALIVTDTNVDPLYLDEIRSICENQFSFVDDIILPAGEQYKNTDSIGKIYEKAIVDGFDRQDFFLALGGGVIGDMTGFAAATYMRGIRFIQIPTTLLSQVDSSIGGKTGVDYRSYKNMVGAFHMPSLVYSAMSSLKTLDDVQFASGMGEVIKHALIKSRSYYTYLSQNITKLCERDAETLMETVYQSNLIKAAVVEKDPKEQGERRLLNFGHTLGHAIEKCSGFSYTHGQCVAFGCLCAIKLSNVTTEEEDVSIKTLMEKSGLETVLRPMSCDDILSAVKKDKKMDHGRIHFILLSALGDAYVDDHVTKERMQSSLKSIMKEDV